MSQPRLTVIPDRTGAKRAGAKRERLRLVGAATGTAGEGRDAGGAAVDQLAGVTERSHWQDRYARKLEVTDLVVVSAAVMLAEGVRFGANLQPLGYPQYFIPAYSVLFALAWMCALALFHTRSPRLIGTGVEEYRRVVAASFWTFGAIPSSRCS